MNGVAPHLVQYQGSKRLLAPHILKYMPRAFHRLWEPFAGMAAISIAAAMEGRGETYFINDVNSPLASLLEFLVQYPDELVSRYREVWERQFQDVEGSVSHYYKVREIFNAGNQSPENMLYLLARCVKGSVRYGKDGKFNQSPDKRRHGTTPANIEKNVHRISELLRGKAVFSSLDYREILRQVRRGDLIYMDPPYQGVSNVHDNRYYSGVSFDEFVEEIERLNRKEVDYLISYDGECGGKEYGEELPTELGCTKVMLRAGLSSQGLFLGRKQVTNESLYISRGLSCRYFGRTLEQQLAFHWEET